MKTNWRCFNCGATDPINQGNGKCRYYRMHFILYTDYEERLRKPTMPLYVILDSPVVGTGTMEEFRKFLVKPKSAKAVISKEEKTMKLEMAILAGDETKRFLVELTKQIDRLEALSSKLKGKAKAEETDDEEETKDTDEDEDEDFAAKPTKSKEKKGKSFDEDEETEESEDETTDEDEDSDEEEKPAKKAKSGKTKKITPDDVNDACKKHAKTNGREATLKVLKKKFKVDSVTELKPEQYEDVIKAMTVEEE